MRSLPVSVFLLFAVLSLPLVAQESVYQAKPIPCGKDAPMRIGFLRRWADWESKRLLEDYKKSEQRDVGWDPSVEFVLGAWPAFLVLTPKDAELRAEIVRAATKARALGCKDPALAQILGNLLQNAGPSEGSLPLLLEVWKALDHEDASATQRFFVAQRLRNLYKRRKETRRAQEFEALLPGILAKALTEENYRGERVRWYQVNVMTTWPTSKRLIPPLTRLIGLVEKARGIDPWVVEMAKGTLAHSKAWVARGGGSAASVDEEGWKGFSEHMDVAQKHFVKAYKLHPEYPEAATWMIKVRNASGGEDWEPRFWFDRAVAAELDHQEAYAMMLWSLRPRWGGTHEKMYAFGRECLETRRFDTAVPRWYWRALRDIGGKGELENQVVWLKRRGVYADVSLYLEGIGKRKQPRASRLYGASVQVIAAYLAGKRDEAAELYLALGKDFVPAAFRLFPSLDAARYQARLDKLLEGRARRKASEKKTGEQKAAEKKVPAKKASEAGGSAPDPKSHKKR